MLKTHERMTCTAQSKLALFKLYPHWMRQWSFLCYYISLKAAAAAPARDVVSGVQNAIRCGNLCHKLFTWRAVFNLTEISGVCFAVHHICPRCPFAAMLLCKLRFLLHFVLRWSHSFLTSSFSLFHMPLPRVLSVRPESCPSEAPTSNLIKVRGAAVWVVIF